MLHDLFTIAVNGRCQRGWILLLTTVCKLLASVVLDMSNCSVLQEVSSPWQRLSCQWRDKESLSLVRLSITQATEKHQYLFKTDSSPSHHQKPSLQNIVCQVSPSLTVNGFDQNTKKLQIPHQRIASREYDRLHS